MTKSDILAENKLFATLDPTSRRLRFPEDVEVIITDTVGFIRDLPPDLMQAFKATLEELAEADLLIHVIDLANPRFAQQMAVVDGVLQELALQTIPCLRVFNKVEQLSPDYVLAMVNQYGGVALSALAPATFGPFLAQAEACALKQWQTRRR